MQFNTFIFFYLFFTIQLYSQITGKIIDPNKKSIPFANVLLIESESQKIIKGTLSDINGDYKIDNIPTGNYFIKVSIVGYSEYLSPPFTVNNTSFSRVMTTIVLTIEATSLDAVSIVSHKKLIEQTPEGNVFNVQESILTKGSTVLQLLERSPGVIFDQRNNNFSLNGKSGTSIMINGKLIRLPTSDIITMLNGMSADSIEKIELLTSPSSKYDADGNAGIINIVSIKNKKIGTLGTVNTSIGYGTGPKQNTSISLNHGTEKIVLHGNYSFSYDDTNNKWRGIGTTELPVFGGVTNIDFSSKTNQLNRGHNLSSGIDFKLNKVSSIGVNLFSNFSKPIINTNNRGLYNFSNTPFLEARINLYGKSNWINHNASGYYEFKGKKSSLNIIGDLINYTNKSPNTVISEYFDQNGISFTPTNEIYNTGNIGINTTDININVLKIDYTKSIDNKLFLEGGLKGTLSRTKNISEIRVRQNEEFVTDNRFINNRKINEKIGALYTIGKYKINESTNAQLGLRYEYWDRNFENSNLNSRFGKLFPTIYLSKKISDTINFNIAYTKRITRPSFRDLAASLTYNSPTSVFSGNPLLQPAITNTLNFSYYYNPYSISLILSNEENPIAGFQIEENSISDLAVIAPQNLKYQNSIDFQANIPIKMNNHWRFNLNTTIGWRQFRVIHTPKPFTHDYVHFNFNASQTLQIHKQLSLEVSGWYTSKHFSGSTSIEGFGVLNMGIKKEFKNNSSLQLSISDILSTFKVSSQIGQLTTEAFNNKFDVDYFSESGISPVIKVSYSKSFGNNNVSKKKINSAASDEKSRID